MLPEQHLENLIFAMDGMNGLSLVKSNKFKYIACALLVQYYLREVRFMTIERCSI